MMTRRVGQGLGAAVLLAAAGWCRPALAILNTRVDWQVTANPADPSSWSSALTAAPGQQVYARALVSYVGLQGPVDGLANFVFQPTIAGWDNTPGVGDVLLPFVNNGIGSNTSTPLGVVTQAQIPNTASFGRISPWGRSATSSTSALRGFFHVSPYGDGVDYLRIAQSQVTAWIGGSGNTTGGSGVSISQLADVGRTTADPPFESGTADVYVFKIGIVFSQTALPHTLVVDSPLEGFGNRNSNTGEREVYWFTSVSDTDGRGTAEVHSATISNIPGPWTLSMVLAGMARRRRRAAVAANTSAPSAQRHTPRAGRGP